jgi:two-component system, LytTR family, sensor kinase
MDKTRNHVIFWVGYFLYNLVTLLPQVGNSLLRQYLLLSLVRNSSICVMFYAFVYSIFPDIFIKKNYIRSGINFLYLLVCLGMFNYFFLSILNYLYPLFFSKFTINKYIFIIAIGIFRALSLAVPFWMFKRYLFEYQQKEIKSRIKNALQEIRLNAQLSGLKNQINPHFMYNILNFLYAQSLSVAPSIAGSVLTLAKLLRYSVQDYGKGKVALEKEISYTQDYIMLEQEENLSSDVIHFDISENILSEKMKYLRVYPQTFIPIIEHCYQCGINVKYNMGMQEDAILFNGTYLKKGNVEFYFLTESFIKTQKRVSSEYALLIDCNPSDNHCNISLRISL